MGRLGHYSAPPARLSSNPAASLRTRICRKTGRLGWAPPDQLDRFPSSQLLDGAGYGEKRSDADKAIVSRTRVAHPPSLQGNSASRAPGPHTQSRRTLTAGSAQLGTTVGPHHGYMGRSNSTGTTVGRLDPERKLHDTGRTDTCSITWQRLHSAPVRAHLDSCHIRYRRSPTIS